MLRHARAGELWFLKEKPGPAAEASGEDAPTEEQLARDEKDALKNLVVSVTDARLRCVRALDPPPDPDPFPRERSPKNSPSPSRHDPTPDAPGGKAHFESRLSQIFKSSARLPARSRLFVAHPKVYRVRHRRSRAAAESRADSRLTLVAPLPVRHVALGLGDAASWESAWQQHKFVLELAAAHASRDSASRGVPLSKLSELCTQKGFPPLKNPQAHNHVNCMVAAGLLGKRDAHIKDRNKDRGASTSVVYLARFAPADAAAAAAASGETRMVSESELPILGGALREALEGPDATEGLMTDKQLMGVLVRTLRSAAERSGGPRRTRATGTR